MWIFDKKSSTPDRNLLRDNFKKHPQTRSFYDFADLVSLLEADTYGINFPGAEKMWTVVAKGNSSKGNLSQVDKLMRRRVRIANDEEIRRYEQS